MRKISKSRLQPIRDVVYQGLRDDIIHGIYKPGERLQEEQLAEVFGTSRTPVREALRKLEVEHFVNYIPHRGTIVSPVAIDEVDELYQVRIMTECFIARRAAVKATDEDIKMLRKSLKNCESCTDSDDLIDAVGEFNELLCKTSRSTSLVDINKRIRENLHRILVSNHLNPERHKRAHQEHIKIVDAIEARDPDLAEKYTREHLSNSPRKLKDI